MLNGLSPMVHHFILGLFTSIHPWSKSRTGMSATNATPPSNSKLAITIENVENTKVMDLHLIQQIIDFAPVNQLSVVTSG
jgi:hypothetical protein